MKSGIGSAWRRWCRRGWACRSCRPAWRVAAWPARASSPSTTRRARSARRSGGARSIRRCCARRWSWCGPNTADDAPHDKKSLTRHSFCPSICPYKVPKQTKEAGMEVVAVGPKRYRFSFGRYLEEFELGAVYEHRPGRTLTDADNIQFSLLTMNFHPMHCDAAYAGQSEFGRLLVNSGLTVAVVLGMTVG